MLSRFRWAAAVLAALLFCGAAAFAVDTAAQRVEHGENSVQTGEDVTGRVMAPVYVNGQGPFRFIVDTGANRSAVSTDLVMRLGLEIAGQSNVHAFTGVYSAPLARVSSLSAGPVRLEDVDLPVMDGRFLAGAYGILGVEAMRDRRLIMDFEAGTLHVDRGETSLAGGNWVSLGGRMRFGNLIVLDGRIGRIDVKVVLDSGANNSVANTSLRERLTTNRALPLPATGTRLTSAAQPIVVNEAVFIPELDFGRANIRNISAYVADVYVFDLWELSDQPAIVVGMDVLGHLEGIAVDYRSGRVHLRL